MRLGSGIACLGLFLAATVRADEGAPVEAPAPVAARSEADEREKTVEELTALVRESVVVVSFSGRDGRRMGLGSGFVISPDGLIATNRHVIGDARPITVQTADGTSYDVRAIHATDESLDLAILRIDAKNLPALRLGDSDALRQGQDVVAIGNPRGLQHSVVRGIVSGRREIDGRPMIQLAMPIEQGNSGGPLLDLTGRVHGILTLKSLVTENLGFAVAINALKPLLEKPNPVPMERWLTIGAIDPKEWTPRFGSKWRQRAGRILVDGRGDGFGGRSLLLSTTKPPEPPFEVAVAVRLEDESGAAGLVFHSDGGDKHYGFYPSNGQLRLSRFDGPDVFSWNVLKEIDSPHYRPGEWNTLKIRVEGNRIQCYVNDELVIEATDGQYLTGQVGLAKFRETQAEFKCFRVAREIPPSCPDEQTARQITELVGELPLDRPPQAELVEKLLPHAEVSPVVLRDEARRLEQEAERLRQLARAVHERSVCREMADLLKSGDDEIDLLHAALLIARLDNEELDVAAYRRDVERMADELRTRFPADADEATRLEALNKYLFRECGFHGSRVDYYNRSNSYLNEVLDDREGLPIMLSTLYMELARRIGLRVVGVGLPGHFVVRHEPREGTAQLLDPFDRGATITPAEAERRVVAATGREFDAEHLRAQSSREILVRMLRNLMGAAQQEGDPEAMLRYTDLWIVLEPDRGEPRVLRAVIRYRTRRIDEALTDADWLLEHEPPDVDPSRVRELREALLHAAK